MLQRMGPQESKISADDVEMIVSLAQPGDILVSFELGRPTGKLIKGKYDHAAGIDDRLKVIDAVGDKFVKDEISGIRKNLGGVRENDLRRWLYQMDGVALIRPTLPKDLRARAGHNFRAYIGTSYDYEFEFGSEKIYCSELPYLGYITEIKTFLASEPEGVEILPQRYRDLSDGPSFLLVYESKSA